MNEPYKDVNNQVDSSQSLADRWLHGVVLGLSLSPIIGAFLYNQGLRLSVGSCRFQQMFGIPSPACGMTRSFMAIARGNLYEAVMYHLFGPILFAVFGIIAIQSGCRLMTGRSLLSRYIKVLANSTVIVIGILAFLAYYGIRLFARYYGEAGILAGLDNPLWQMLVTGAKAL